MMSDNEKDGGPAFPVTLIETHSEIGDVEVSTYSDKPGMTLRDYFAAHAPQTVWAIALHRRTTENQTLEKELASLAECAFAYADAMIAARKK
jgi:hypothetical protein